VVWHWGVTVQTLQAAAAGAHRYVGTLSDGTSLAADAVLSAVGLRADTALAAQAGIACARGVLVNAHLQTSAPGVYALGDCAQYASAGGRTLPYVMPIMHAARALAATLAGTPTELVFPLMPVAVKTPALPITGAAPHPDLQGS
jgi:rubredoxin-NAD+ reductase